MSDCVSSAEEALFSWEFHPPFTPFHPFVNRVGVKVCACIKSSVLGNEKYIGDALLQKTVTTDFLNKKRVANKGIVPQYYVENSHEAIIPRELFLQVREEMVRRARVKTATGKRRVYSGKYALSHLIYCSDCGDLYRRTQWYLKGEHVPVWRCVSRLEKRKSGIDCPSRTLYETDLHAAVITAFNQMIEQKDEFLPGMRLAMDRALAQNNSPRVAEIDARSEELQKELLKKANAKQGFEELADEIDALREEKQALLLERAACRITSCKLSRLRNRFSAPSIPSRMNIYWIILMLRNWVSVIGRIFFAILIILENGILSSRN